MSPNVNHEWPYHALGGHALNALACRSLSTLQPRMNGGDDGDSGGVSESVAGTGDDGQSSGSLTAGRC